MKIEQIVLRGSVDVTQSILPLQEISPQLVLCFGTAKWLSALSGPLKSLLPAASLLGCTTAGEISTQGVSDDTCVVTGLRFSDARLQTVSTTLASMEDSFAAGQRLGEQLVLEGLRAVLLIGQGVRINGSAMIAGMTAALGPDILITGGLAGDAAAFRETFVLDNDGLHTDRVACVGLYGQGLRISHGSYGGWMPFGPARKVTRCDNNVLYELDGEPALKVYERYLGEHARDLPASGLLFPFAMLGSDHNEVGLIRTILAIDEGKGSLTLAGDIDPNGYLRLMHASANALVDGAQTAAQAACQMLQPDGSGLALLVSCVGRKLVMGGRVEEEVEAVVDVLNKGSILTGFYSNGEISPFTGGLDCKLHNQTMTITYLSEAAEPA